MSQNEIDYRIIRRKAEEQLQKDKRLMRVIFLVVYFFLFLLFLVMGWGFYLSNGGTLPQPNIPGVSSENNPVTAAMVLLSTLGFLGLLFQFIAVLVDTKFGERQMRERAYGRILGQELMRLGDEDDSSREKAKHMTRLTDDGELEEVPLDEEYVEEDIKREQR